ncbi:relaxase/mobilization nuclease domain-containing protein [Streptomyces sp. NRRL B-24484]|uniref:relaxase/mobilization nuclease domain-containing protein n=1 Tax=Streptomyces sp. NRRL B-24484 TaxID=1463833 RepID=UPI000694410F|nr:hypothetical protein [Streptomyces sp. NRRL B-24484]
MIAKITKGRKAAGAIRYDFGPGRRDEHHDPRVVAGTVPGTPQQIARIIDHHTRPSGLTSPIWRCSLSLPDEDGILPDRQWAEIATAYVERMGYGACPWVAVRHGDDHIHLTVSRVGWDRRTVPDRGDYIRSMPIVRALEREHGLVDAGALSNRTAPQVSGQERAAAVKRGADEPERLQIRAAVYAARDAAAGRGRAEFERLLAEAGVDFRANVASTGRMNGYSFSIPAWTDADGARVWVTASKTARDLAWQKLAPVLEPPADAPPVLTADLARTKLAEARERVGRQRAELAQELAALPAGTVADLPTALRVTRSALDSREKTLAREAAASMRLDGIASGVSAGPRLAGLRQYLADLELAAGAEAEAIGHATAAAQQRQQADAARRVQAEAVQKAGARWSLPKRRADAEGMAAAAEEWAARCEAEAVLLDRRADDARRRAETAAPQGTGEPYVRALEDLVTGWSAAEAAAIREDRQAAKLQYTDQLGPLQAARVEAAKARKVLDQLGAEQLRRAALPPDRLALENSVRADLAAQARAAAARSTSPTTGTRRTPPKKAGPSHGARPPHLRPGQDPRKGGPGLGR